MKGDNNKNEGRELLEAAPQDILDDVQSQQIHR